MHILFIYYSCIIIPYLYYIHMYTYNTYIYIYIFMSISVWKDNSFLDDVSTTYMNKKETTQNLCKYRTIGEVL